MQSRKANPCSAITLTSSKYFIIIVIVNILPLNQNLMRDIANMNIDKSI